MSKVTAALIGLGLLAVGCQAPPRPAEAPATTQAAPPPPAPPPPPGPEGGHPGMPPGHAGPPGHAAPPGHPGGPPPGGHPGMHGSGPGGPGMGMHGMQGMHGMGPGRGPQGHGAEMMHELAALGVRFYPPPMLLRRAKQIDLTADQITKLRQEVLSTKGRAVELKAKVERARIEATRLLAADKVDERALNAQIDEGAKAQAELHKLHVGSMLRVRALLTAEQRQKLDAPRPHRGGPGMGPRGPRAEAAPPGALGQGGPRGEDDDDDDDDDDDADT